MAARSIAGPSKLESRRAADCLPSIRFLEGSPTPRRSSDRSDLSRSVAPALRPRRDADPDVASGSRQCGRWRDTLGTDACRTGHVLHQRHQLGGKLGRTADRDVEPLARLADVSNREHEDRGNDEGVRGIGSCVGRCELFGQRGPRVDSRRQGVCAAQRARWLATRVCDFARWKESDAAHEARQRHHRSWASR